VESQRSLRTSGYLLEIWAAPTPGRMALIHIWMVLGPHSMMGGKAGSLWRWCAIAWTLSSGCSSPQTIVQLNEVVLLRGGRETTRCAEGKCEDVSSNGRESEWKDGEWKDGEWKDGEWKDGEWKNGDFHIYFSFFTTEEDSPHRRILRWRFFQRTQPTQHLALTYRGWFPRHWRIQTSRPSTYHHRSTLISESLFFEDCVRQSLSSDQSVYSTQPAADFLCSLAISAQ
jgi:hypothetical protein